jgi:alkyldihydroxyacetonephosphate synthase
MLLEKLGEEKVILDPRLTKDRRRDTWVMSILDELQGNPPDSPRCVVRPVSTEDVVHVVNACRETRTPLIPFGLGSGVCGGVRTFCAAVVLDMSSMNRIRAIDVDDLTVTLEAGVRGVDAEEALGKRGLTLGHYPQSMELSTVGGWVATRSSGQFSTAYGSIEEMVLALEVVLPWGDVFRGRLTPRAAAGPDLKHLFLGSEGSLGVITAVTLSVRWRPQSRALGAFHAPTMETGLEAQRYVIQSGWTPAVMRQYDPTEAQRLFPEHTRGDEALILVVHEGPASMVEAERASCRRLMEEAGCSEAAEEAARKWLEERNKVVGFEPFLKAGLILDTVEVASTWSRISRIYRRVIESLRGVEGLLVASAHSSHCYRSGVNLYFTFAAKPPEPSKRGEVYWECWRRIMEATLDEGGSIVHHHGIGRVRKPWLPHEIGQSGVGLLRALKRALDPFDIMNPEVLIPDD